MYCIISQKRFYILLFVYNTQKFVEDEFQQTAYFVGSKIWSNLRDINLSKLKSHRIHVSNQLFHHFGKSRLQSISDTYFKHKTKHYFNNIEGVSFYKLFGKVYCFKQDSTGYHYIDPQKVIYDEKQMMLTIQYVVCHKNIHQHRCRLLPIQ